MLILGDISGIQNYLFDVAEAGGGQARRLRARSFIIQLVAETAALRILRALNWPLDNYIQSAAGKFILRGPADASIIERLTTARQVIDDWFLRETRGELRLALATADGPSEVEAYRQAQRELQRVKARPWAPPEGVGWESSRLVLAPIGEPCDLCRHATAMHDEPDSDRPKVVRRVCRWCSLTRQLGSRLRKARQLVIREPAQDDDIELFGFGVADSAADRVVVGAETVAVANLKEPTRRPEWCPKDKFLPRRLMAHVPLDKGRTPTWFEDLAKQSRGDRLLGVLKADADSLGVAIERRLTGSDLRPLEEFSEKLDAFFAGRLKEEIELGDKGRWRSVYTVFAGGDDLVMVGPWDMMLDFAGRMRELFRGEFDRDKLTLSAGLALSKWKRPIKPAIAEAERLLELAKQGGKDRIACLGQMWRWDHHAQILQEARRLVAWVDGGQMERGWLHTLLGLAEARHPGELLHQPEPVRQPDALATARLAHHVERNYRRAPAVLTWGRSLVDRFDDVTATTMRYLPVILRYALTATRTPGEED